MTAVRVIGWVLLLAGVVVLGRDVLAWIDSRVLAPVSLGVLWRELHPASLQALEDMLAPWLLQVVSGILAIPASVAFLVIGLAVAWSGRRDGASRARRRRGSTRSPS